MTESGRACRFEDLSEPEREAVEAARTARTRAHAPYSGYRVGAAVRDRDGRLQAGCNVEISSYGLTLCAERVALFAAVAAGHGPAELIVVVGPGDGSRPTPPCGACRQVILDLAPDAEVLLATPDGAVERWRATDLLPRAFGPRHLAGEAGKEPT